MLKKRFFGVMFLFIGIMLVFALVSCDMGGRDDAWTNITSLSQIDGTWRGSFGQAFTIREYVENVGEIAWTTEMATIYGDMRVTLSVNMTMTVNANSRMSTGTITQTIVLIGGNINTLWPSLRQEFSRMPGFTVTINDANHSITALMNIPPELTSVSDFEGTHINQNWTKMRLPAGELWQGSPEIILTKL
jgi:hypothetical protein